MNSGRKLLKEEGVYISELISTMDETSFESTEKLAAFIRDSSDGIARVLQALSYEKRLVILSQLARGKQSNTSLQEVTGFTPSLLGNHLSTLTEVGLIRKVSRGVYDITAEGNGFLQHVADAFFSLQIREKQRLLQVSSLIGKYQQEQMISSTGEHMNQELQVNVVELMPFRYASFHALGTNPEPIALAKLQEWATQKNYTNLADHPIYGFNNPDPEKGKAEYGYEFWLVVGDDEQGDDQVIIKEFSGGRYLVTTTMLFPVNADNVIPAWPRLVQWAKANEFTIGTHQWLEKAITPNASEKDAMLDLYLPIE